MKIFCLIILLLIVTGCSSVYGPEIISLQDLDRLTYGSQPAQPDKLAEWILQQCKVMGYDIPHY